MLSTVLHDTVELFLVTEPAGDALLQQVRRAGVRVVRAGPRELKEREEIFAWSFTASAAFRSAGTSNLLSPSALIMPFFSVMPGGHCDAGTAHRSGAVSQPCYGTPCFLRGALCRGNSITPSTRLTLSCCLQTGQLAFMCPLSVASRWCRAPRTGRRLPSQSSFIHSSRNCSLLIAHTPISGKSPTACERIGPGQARQSVILRRYAGLETTARALQGVAGAVHPASSATAQTTGTSMSDNMTAALPRSFARLASA
jgi:hypothetical protein